MVRGESAMKRTKTDGSLPRSIIARNRQGQIISRYTYKSDTSKERLCETDVFMDAQIDAETFDFVFADKTWAYCRRTRAWYRTK